VRDLMRRATIGRWRVDVPQTWRERSRGLLGRTAIGPDQAMLLERCRSVHTVGMRFAIDAVLLDHGYRVLAVVHLPPGRILLPRPGVRHVLEVAPGQAPPLGIRLRVSLCPTSTS
jgi:uncharacterized membrane protein (UPF0127 family)